jgi:hypothetical protein
MMLPMPITDSRGPLNKRRTGGRTRSDVTLFFTIAVDVPAWKNRAE